MESTKEQRIRNISELKFNLKTVIQNIRLLEKGSTSLEIIDQTETILDKLENQPGVIKSIIQKRHRQRIKRKTKAKNDKTKEAINQQFRQPSQSFKINSTNPSQSAQSHPPKIKIQKIHNDAQKYLEKFDLLENLYELRNHNIKDCVNFTAKLDSIRTIWKEVMQANILTFQTEEERIANNWNETFFGSHNKEENFNRNKPKKIARKEFLSNRRIWDSYLITNKNFGSTIPIGWILPKENASKEWIKYRKT